MKGKHTPGPWKMGHAFPDGDISILNESGLTTICTVHNHAADAATDDSAQRRNAETKANLNMIVAAPQLLAQAEFADEEIGKHMAAIEAGEYAAALIVEILCDIQNRARAAIQVAETGRAE